MRVPYYCPHCNHRSTRRWNLDVHIKRKHGGYLLGGSSGRFMGNKPPLYSKTFPFGHATIPDNVGNVFQPRYSTSIPQYSASPMYPPRQTMNDLGNRTGLTQDNIVKIQELKRLLNKYPEYNRNPDGILRWAIRSSINGDNVFLNDKLEQLRTINSLAKY
jgi:hypothetical protein